ncbi:MAG: 4'-phosphopantetheinyl transferase superfamily protein [Desulfobacterales bacterium]|nr:MAG: 4'-phosphopantetheinyl transferase superfamily protein [Desulfobacterales bacterium]
MDKLDTIFPVILPVPAEVAEFKPRDRVIFLSRHARAALQKSAEKSGVRLDELVKDGNGVPQPFDGTFWSVTHKTQYVAGVAAPTPTGIDIERIRSFSDGLFQKTASDREWALADMEKKAVMTFFRFWTAKEAVLKATGIGIKDLLKCRIHQIIDDNHLRIHYEGRDWLIEHLVFDRHIASIVQNRYRIDWSVEQR